MPPSTERQPAATAFSVHPPGIGTAGPRTLTASQVLLRAKALEIESVEHLAARAELVDVLGRLIHELQRERGASSIFLASSGQRFDAVRQQAVAQARPVERRLRQLFAAHLEPGLGASPRKLSLMAWVLLGLDELEALRVLIAEQRLTAHDAVAAYSRLIAGGIELIFQVADAAVHPDGSRLLVALLHLIQGKEAAGQERAVGALMFASGQCDAVQQQRVLHLIDAQERSLRVFEEFAPDDLERQWAQDQLTPDVARLERLRRLLCATRPSAALDPNQSDPWFEVCSLRISKLWALQQELVGRLRLACQDQLDAARQALADSEGLIRQLRENPPSHTHAVDRFFDAALGAAALPEPSTVATGTADAEGHGSASMAALLKAQSDRLARMEAELDAARRALHERKLVERAKGLLMARLGLDEEAAFRLLQKTSMHQNRRLVEVAEATLSLPELVIGRAKTGTPAG